MRYVYLGDKLTDSALVGQECDPVRRPDGKCIVSQRFATQLVRFADGSIRVVLRRRLRVQKQASGVEVSMRMKIDVADLASWPPSTVKALLVGIGQVVAAGNP